MPYRGEGRGNSTRVGAKVVDDQTCGVDEVAAITWKDIIFQVIRITTAFDRQRDEVDGIPRRLFGCGVRGLNHRSELRAWVSSLIICKSRRQDARHTSRYRNGGEVVTIEGIHTNTLHAFGDRDRGEAISLKGPILNCRHAARDRNGGEVVIGKGPLADALHAFGDRDRGELVIAKDPVAQLHTARNGDRGELIIIEERIREIHSIVRNSHGGEVVIGEGAAADIVHAIRNSHGGEVVIGEDAVADIVHAIGNSDGGQMLATEATHDTQHRHAADTVGDIDIPGTSRIRRVVSLVIVVIMDKVTRWGESKA